MGLCCTQTHIHQLRGLLTNIKEKDEQKDRPRAAYEIECSDCQATYNGVGFSSFYNIFMETSLCRHTPNFFFKISFSSLGIKVILTHNILKPSQSGLSRVWHGFFIILQHFHASPPKSPHPKSLCRQKGFFLSISGCYL